MLIANFCETVLACWYWRSLCKQYTIVHEVCLQCSCSGLFYLFFNYSIIYIYLS